MTARRKILKRLTSGTMATFIVSLTAHSVFAAIVYWLPITINTPPVVLNIVEIQVVTETSAINSENQDKVILATEEVSEGKTEAENITLSPESTPVFDSEPLV